MTEKKRTNIFFFTDDKWFEPLIVQEICDMQNHLLNLCEKLSDTPLLEAAFLQGYPHKREE